MDSKMRLSTMMRHRCERQASHSGARSTRLIVLSVVGLGALCGSYVCRSTSDSWSFVWSGASSMQTKGALLSSPKEASSQRMSTRKPLISRAATSETLQRRQLFGSIFGLSIANAIGSSPVSAIDTKYMYTGMSQRIARVHETKFMGKTETVDVIPVIDLINIYGRLAGRSCFGDQVGKGASCQVTMDDFDRVLFHDGESSSITQTEFIAALRGQELSWPLKPAPNNEHTALAFKVAEFTSLNNEAVKNDIPKMKPRDLVKYVSAQLQDSFPDNSARGVFNRFINVVGSKNEDVLEREQIRAWLDYEDVAPSGRVQIPAIKNLDWPVFLKTVMTYVLVEWPNQSLFRTAAPTLVNMHMHQRGGVVLDQTNPSSPYLKPVMQ